MGDAAPAVAPPPPADTSPDVQVEASHYRLTVSNAHGYLCRITCDARYPGTPPEAIYKVLTNDNNTGVFRDIADVASRTVISTEGAKKVVEVEQLGHVRLLFKNVSFTTRLRVTEDATGAPDRYVSAFHLLSSPVLAAFDGEWVMRPDGHGGSNVTLTQDVTPRGVPPWMKRVPVVGGAIKGACARAVERVLADLGRVADAVAAGESVEAVLARARRDGKV